MQIPHLVQFDRIGNSSLGYLSVAEHNNLPFPVKRVYWTYFTPESVTRGGHAHRRLNQILVAVAGRIIINTEMRNGRKDLFVLEDPDRGLFLPVDCWRTMKYSHNAVQMVICSMEYSEADYIRDYDIFKAENDL